MSAVPTRRVAARGRLGLALATHAIVGSLSCATIAFAGSPEPAAAALTTGAGAAHLVAAAGISGRVLLDASPVAEARVFAYQLVEKSIHRVLTDGAGAFLFEALPAGIYKIIAHKTGFAPSVLLLQRQAADAAQFVTLKLEAEDAAGSADFWSVRAQVPGDVLRELAFPESTATPDAEPQLADVGIAGTAPSLNAQVSAVTGVSELKPDANARLSGGDVGVTGELGGVKVFLRGNFQKLESEAGDPAFSGASAFNGVSSSVSVNLQTPSQGVFNLESTANRLNTSQDGLALPVEASQYRIGWNRNVGENGATSVRAFYLEESGLYNKGWIEPLGLPFASRTLQLEGDYSHQLAKGSVSGGIRFRERTGLYSRRYAGTTDELASEVLDAFGGGDWELSNAVVVEYGMFTTLRDGSVSLTPRGGVVLRLGPNWQTSASLSQRLELSDNNYLGDFTPLFVDDVLDCGKSESSCYELGVQRGSGSADYLALGAAYREVDSTLRLFLSGNFFDHTEGLFLVPGDELPELNTAWRRRLTPEVVTKWSARYAEGGGGTYESVSRRRFENNVTLVSTSLDTTFEATSTGVFVSFHRLVQRLDQVGKNPRQGFLAPEADLERLELVVSQNLSQLLNLSSDWAVRLGMELARGASFFHSDVDPEVLRRQIMTGVAVRF